MSYRLSSHQSRMSEQPNPASNRLRNASNASTNSSTYSTYSNPFPPSRTSTLSSSSSSGLKFTGAGHKRGISEASGMMPFPATDGSRNSDEANAAGTYKSLRQSLRPLPQPPSISPPVVTKTGSIPYTRGTSVDLMPTPQENSATSVFRKRERSSSIGIGRSTSISGVHAATHPPPPAHVSSVITTPDLKTLQKSSTSHFRTLSKFAQSGAGEDFSITSPAPSVVGMQGRRQLKRTCSTKANRKTLGNGTGYIWTERNWMDKQRQFLQAYEYLCHIGEAKEWIENVIQKPIPPIVQLEEALRDGVTLAEVVQALCPERHIRIFRSDRLQFRHSDNIAVFFRFLGDVDLPELFRFELIDLYEKKNIPKVIYCVHALSWLLYRKGIVEFRIGNLVGQLEFEHHELEEMQKGLDKAGINMPSFSGMGASFGAEPEPEPEPVETEEQRIERVLYENEATVQDLQAQIRGALVRRELGQKMQRLWAAEEMLIDLQSRIRGDWARQIAGYRLDMKRFAVNLQSAARGYLVRSRMTTAAEWWKAKAREVVIIQSLARGRKGREAVMALKKEVRTEAPGIRFLQAAIRGALSRKRVHQQLEETKYAEAGVTGIQAAIRGMLERQRVETMKASFRQQQNRVTALQAAFRGKQARARCTANHQALQGMQGLWRTLQAISRGKMVRDELGGLQQQLGAQETGVISLQSLIRGIALRQQIAETKDALHAAEQGVLRLQSFARGFLTRKQYNRGLNSMKGHSGSITALQGHFRGYLAREKYKDLHAELSSHADEIGQLQGLARAMLLRSEVGALLAQLENEEDAITMLQAAARGKMVRDQFAEKMKFYQENMQKVIKLQSFVRGRIQGEAYKSLTAGKNPPVGTIKGFVHLLNDSDFDFDEEIELDRSREVVIQHVRQNEKVEEYITQLDVKVALLVKNKITLDEVVKHQRHFGGHVGNLLTNNEMLSKDPFDLKALNKNSRRKLEHYQRLFFVLQTQPQYLARVFRGLREQTTGEREAERLKPLMMSLFGYAQKSREEYYLLKLMAKSINEEVDCCTSIQDYLRTNFFWSKLFGAYIRSPRDRKFMRDVLGPMVKESIIENDDLDLESDPMQIYLSAIEDEQLRTGRKSRRTPDITREEAIRDPETREIFIHHLQDLRDLADQFFTALEELLHKMPYGVRYIAQQMFVCLCSRFPREEDHMLQIVGHWVWKNYLQLALTEPEKCGVVDRGLSQVHKKNLAEVAKVLNQIAAGRLFGGENVYLQPLNGYVGDSIHRLGEIWKNLISVPDAESQFNIDEFNDLYARTKPTLYIKMADIFSIHSLVVLHIANICPSKDDVLREIVRELGNAKDIESDLMAASTSEITLTLVPKLHDLEDPNAEVKALFMETKRCILYIIRVQSGANLLEIMVKPITMEDEERWQALVREELSLGSRKRAAYSEANTLGDIASLPYSDLKRTALQNFLRLEKLGIINRHNYYQDVLNAIAVDIRTKHRRRIQRQRELESVKSTLARLKDQALYLEQKLKTYNNYVEQAMTTLHNNGKKRFTMPFTKQWEHKRELQRSGRVPKFGSYKYSAQDLANRGILVSWTTYNEGQWDKIDLTISSDKVGEFALEGSSGAISIPGASCRITLDSILEAQYNNIRHWNVFQQTMRLNLDLFIQLVVRKFFKDRD